LLGHLEVLLPLEVIEGRKGVDSEVPGTHVKLIRDQAVLNLVIENGPMSLLKVSSIKIS